MFIKQLYTPCLSEAAYFIESNGEAAIIDPLRDTDVYHELAKERNATIRYIFETHFHADFVSGHLDLQRATGAPIVFGPNTQTRFPIHRAHDKETFRIGNIQLIALHTPGHTIESTCYLLIDESGKPHALFSGDTLFVNDVGRPDLGSGNNSTEELASMLYDSLHEKLLKLPDDVIVYPAHGPGSSCGKNIGPEKQSTIGEQKLSNDALQHNDRTSFIESVTAGLNEPPRYFEENARINREGYESLTSLLERALSFLSIKSFKEAAQEPESIILDTRQPEIFTEGFVPESLNIGLNGRLAEWAGNLIRFDQSILLITDAGQEKETIIRLARVGFNKFKGILQGGFDAWKDAGEQIDMIINVEPDELAMDIPFDDHLVIVDVRGETEFANAHVKDAVNIPLEEMPDPASIANIEDTQNLYIHCASGYRSVTASSWLKRQGIHNLRNIVGGFKNLETEQRIEIVKDDSLLN